MILWMEVTQDKYELPVAVAESKKELAEMRGIKPKTIQNAIMRAKSHGWQCKYKKVYVEE